MRRDPIDLDSSYRIVRALQESPCGTVYDNRQEWRLPVCDLREGGISWHNGNRISLGNSSFGAALSL